jgi:hypothetical protein
LYVFEHVAGPNQAAGKQKATLNQKGFVHESMLLVQRNEGLPPLSRAESLPFVL